MIRLKNRVRWTISGMVNLLIEEVQGTLPSIKKHFQKIPINGSQITSSIAIFLVGLPVPSLIGQPGTLVTDFGNMGIVNIDIDGRNDVFDDVITSANGDVVAVGNSSTTDESHYIIGKFDRDGKPFESFGDHGLIEGSFDSMRVDRAASVGLDSEDNIIVALNSYRVDSRVYIAKFTQLGKIDSTFADNGIFLFDYQDHSWTCNTLLINPVGDIYVAAEAGKLISLFKLDASGTLDSTFATNGILIIDNQNNFQRVIAMAFQPDGNLILTGEANLAQGINIWKLFLMSITTMGNIDSTFGGSGYVVEDQLQNNSTSHAIVIDTDGKIIVTGAHYNGSINDALFMRYLPDGTLDPFFGNAGIVILPTGSNNIMRSIYILPDSKIIAGGDRAMIQILMNGTVDTSFGDAGIVHGPDVVYRISRMVLDLEENIIVAGSFYNGHDLDFNLLKYETDYSTSVSRLDSPVYQFSVSPNPFQHYLTLSYDLETAQQIDVLLYDLNGRKVQTLWFNEFRNVGSYHERIRVASNLYPGQYFMIFKAGKRKQILRLIKQ